MGCVFIPHPPADPLPPRPQRHLQQQLQEVEEQRPIFTTNDDGSLSFFDAEFDLLTENNGKRHITLVKKRARECM